MYEKPLTLDIREVMRDNAINLVEALLSDNQPFRLVLWNNNNWNAPLPDNIMESFPIQLVIDIKQMALEESFVNDKTGDVIITTMFEGIEYQKVLDYDEILAVLDLDGQPYILNNFKPELNLEDSVKEFFAPEIPTTKKEIVELAVSDGCEKVAIERSFDIFIKNNPELANRFKG